MENKWQLMTGERARYLAGRTTTTGAGGGAGAASRLSCSFCRRRASFSSSVRLRRGLPPSDVRSPPSSSRACQEGQCEQALDPRYRTGNESNDFLPGTCRGTAHTQASAQMGDCNVELRVCFQGTIPPPRLALLATAAPLLVRLLVAGPGPAPTLFGSHLRCIGLRRPARRARLTSPARALRSPTSKPRAPPFQGAQVA